MKRALRRHHKQRMIARANNICNKIWYCNGVYVFSHEQLSRLADNLKPCSCDMCCNPRRSPWTTKLGKLTIQELKELEKWKSYWE